MAYIIVDLEWNQSYTGKGIVEDKRGHKLYGEIIQIGAVKLSDSFVAQDSFKINIKPKFYKVIHHKVKQITGITQKELNCGKDFVTAISEFRAWCGQDSIFLTWGPDDMRILRQNLDIYKLETSWAETWFNVQMIYNLQTDGGSNQKALSTAMEHFGIEATRPMHDALNDAYYTALIAAKLDMRAGIARLLSDAAHAAIKDETAPLACEFYGGFESRREAFAEREVARVRCPECRGACDMRKWVYERRSQYMTLAECKTHGHFLVKLKFSKKTDGKYRVTKSMYAAGEGADALYEKCLEKCDARKKRIDSARQGRALRKKDTSVRTGEKK